MFLRRKRKKSRKIAFLISLFLTWISPSELKGETLDELEVKVLTQYNDFLAEIEQETVQQIQLNPNSSFAHYLMTYVYLRFYTSHEGLRNSYGEKALERAQEALDLDPKSDFGYIALCDVYQTLGFTDKANAILKNAPQKTWRVLYRALKFQYEDIPPSKALEALEYFAKKNPESRDLIFPLMILLSRNLENGPLKDILLGWNERYEHPLLKQELALYYIAIGQLKEAENIFESILSSSEAYPEIYVNYGSLLRTSFRNNKRALIVLNTALKLKYIPKYLQSEVYEHLALISIETEPNSYLILQAMEMSLKQISTLNTLAQALLKKGNEQEFEYYTNKILERFPGKAEFYAVIGNIYSERLENQKEALGYFRKANILDAGNANYSNYIGISYFRMNDLDTALKHFNHALKLDPNDAVAFYNKACVFSRQGKSEKALKSLKKALEIDPSLQEEALRDSDFASLRDLSTFKDMTSQKINDPNGAL